MDKEDRDYWLINFSVTTASSEHSNYLYNSSVESIKDILDIVQLGLSINENAQISQKPVFVVCTP